MGAAWETVRCPSVTVLLVSVLLFLDHYQLLEVLFLIHINHSSLLSLELFHLLHKKFRFFSICDEIYTH